MKRSILFFFLLVCMISAESQNLALTAVASASASSSGSYGPANWNDGNIGPQYYFGWLGTASTFVQPPWIQYEWSSPQTFNQIIFHPPTWSQPGYIYFSGSAQIQFWNGTAWINHHTYLSGIPGMADTVSFTTITAQKLRVSNFVITGADNPGWDEIQVYNQQVVIPPKPDVAVCLFVLPADTVAANSTHTVRVMICNTGDTVLYQVPLSYFVKGGVSAIHEIWQIPTGFAVGDTMGYTFVAPLIVSADSTELCVYAALPGDIDPSNDTLCKLLVVPPDPGIGIKGNGLDAAMMCHVAIFPQPAGSKMFLERAITSGNLLYSLCDLQGKQIIGGLIAEGSGQIVLDVATIPSGVYLMRFSQDNYTEVRKVIVNHSN